MNKKEKVKILLVIVLIVFTIIPFLTTQLRNLFKIEEGLTVNLKTSGENADGIKLGLEADGASGENTQIDRIKTSDNKYKYCIGDVSCSTGSLVQEGTDAYMLLDGTTTKVGYTYAEMCSDNTTPVDCSGTSSISKFYGPFNGLPEVFQVNGNNLLISDSMPAMYSNGANGANSANSANSTTVESSDKDKTKDDDSNKTLKCLADNGAVAGDPLCCGQKGVVQNTKYNCPSEYPHCVGYKCGETWGKCSKTKQ